MQHFIKLSSREYPFIIRLAATLAAGIVFAYLIPLLIVKQGPRLDAILNLPAISPGIIRIFSGAILVLAGSFYALWSILSQLLRAGGTPLPVIPTQRLLVNGPFKQSRNPMTFGTILLYLGVGIISGSISSVILVLLFGGLLAVYLKLVEERELTARFGQEYLDYKRRTPFLIPRIIPRQ